MADFRWLRGLGPKRSVLSMHFFGSSHPSKSILRTGMGVSCHSSVLQKMWYYTLRQELWNCASHKNKLYPDSCEEFRVILLICSLENWLSTTKRSSVVHCPPIFTLFRPSLRQKMQSGLKITLCWVDVVARGGVLVDCSGISMSTLPLRWKKLAVKFR